MPDTAPAAGTAPASSSSAADSTPDSVEFVALRCATWSIATLLVLGGVMLSPPALFVGHPVALAAAFPLLGEAIPLGRAVRAVRGGKNKSHVVHRHRLLALLAAAAFCVALGVIYTNKEFAGKPHFTSWHGQAGVAAVSLMALQASVGICLFGIKITSRAPLADWLPLQKLHRALNHASYLAVFAACFLGFRSGWAIEVLGRMALIGQFGALIGTALCFGISNS